MQSLIEKVMGRLLTELRNIAGNAPSNDTYYAMQYKGGYVGYYDLIPDKNGYVQLKSIDPNDPNRYFGSVSSNYVAAVETDPVLKKAADKLVQLGIIFIKDENFDRNKDITWKYTRELQKLYPKFEDMPDMLQRYAFNYDYRTDNTLKVDHVKRAIDLDANYKHENNRRGDPTKNGETSRTVAAYVIPSGTTAFEHNELGLQKMLKFLMEQDPKITTDYKIIGDEKYRKMTVEQLIEKPGEVQAALTGRGKVVMFHGTSAERWYDIQKKGLRPGKFKNAYVDQVEGWSNKNVYLTFDHVVAENYATRQAIIDNSDAAVLRVEIPDFTKLMPDEDEFDRFLPKRKYKIQLSTKQYDGKLSNPYEFEVGGDTDEHVSTLMRIFGENRVIMDDEGKALYEELMQYVKNELPKKSLKAGVIAYRGIIPSKFIQLDMTYNKKRFKTSERKGGPDDDEYDTIRTSVQQNAKRYDETLLRSFIDRLIR